MKKIEFNTVNLEIGEPHELQWTINCNICDSWIQPYIQFRWPCRHVKRVDIDRARFIVSMYFI